MYLKGQFLRQILIITRSVLKKQHSKDRLNRNANRNLIHPRKLFLT